MAQERAQENQSSLQKDLDARKAGNGGHIQHELMGDTDVEAMDTSSSIPNGSVNGYSSGSPPDHANGTTPSSELQEFVTKTFRKHFVLTLNEFKRLLNLHLASMPAGWNVFPSVSDHMLQDAMLLCHCKQILVPVSIQAGVEKTLKLKILYVFLLFFFSVCSQYDSKILKTELVIRPYQKYAQFSVVGMNNNK